MSTFAVANGLTAAVKDAFQHRPHDVDTVPGFVRMEVISPIDAPDEICLLTFWTDADSFQQWHRSEAHHDSHRGMPKGLKLVPKSARLRFFEHVSS